MDHAPGGRYAVTMDPLVPTVVSGVFKSLLTRGVFAQVGYALEARRARKVERAFQLLVDSLVDVSGLPSEEAEARIEHLLTAGEEGVTDPHEALYEAFRSFAFTRTEAAWPYIARMTAEYIAHSRAIDSFFRRTGRLLERAEPEDIDLLSRLASDTFSRREELGYQGAPRWTSFSVSLSGANVSAECPTGGWFVARTSWEWHWANETLLLLQDSRLGATYPDEEDQYRLVFTKDDRFGVDFPRLLAGR